jgi:hypothetical protein
MSIKTMCSFRSISLVFVANASHYAVHVQIERFQSPNAAIVLGADEYQARQSRSLPSYQQGNPTRIELSMDSTQECSRRTHLRRLSLSFASSYWYYHQSYHCLSSSSCPLIASVWPLASHCYARCRRYHLVLTSLSHPKKKVSASFLPQPASFLGFHHLINGILWRTNGSREIVFIHSCSGGGGDIIVTLLLYCGGASSSLSLSHETLLLSFFFPVASPSLL